jgi:hypothetical protein
VIGVVVLVSCQLTLLGAGRAVSAQPVGQASALLLEGVAGRVLLEDAGGAVLLEQ